MHLLKQISLALLCSMAIPYAHAAVSFDKLIGVDYQPNHYPNGHAFNFHDVFYVGNTSSGDPITNIYAELTQLNEAGFKTIRSYQTSIYSWVDLINQAHALGLKVIYEAVIPQLPIDQAYPGCPISTATSGYITCAQATLNAIINQVTPSVFDNTVILVLAGHENYCQAGNTTPPCNNPSTSNIAYLVDAVTALKSTLTTATLSTPVSSALISGNLVTPSAPISADMVTLTNSYSSDAPIAFDPYPFQWGVTPATAVWTSTLTNTQPSNSLAYDYIQVVGSTSPNAEPGNSAPTQPFYSSPRVLLAAETGWATAGTTSAYACNSPGPCDPSISSAVAYYQSLYQALTNNFVMTSGYHIGVLAFEAYDEPTKGVSDAEGNYGLFDSNCHQKAAGLVPHNRMVSTKGCQGFTNGALMTIVGFGHPYTAIIKQTNPSTGESANITVSSTGNKGPLADAPWPVLLVYQGATITIRGTPSCTSTIQSINSNQQITFSGNCNCPNDNSNNCYY